MTKKSESNPTAFALSDKFLDTHKNKFIIFSMKTKAYVVIVAFILCIFTASVQAAENHRMDHQYGGYISLLGDPYITLTGFNAAANATPYMRVNVGYGSWTPTFTYTDGTSETVKTTTAAVGVKFMHPEWNFTPVVGLNYAYINFNRANKPISSASYGLGDDTSATYPYWTLGIEYTAGNGFYVGLGYNKALGIFSSVSGLPYLSLGWFF